MSSDENNQDIDNVLESDSKSEHDDILDINADTETMNNQLEKHMKNKHSQNISDDNKKIITIDKNVLKTLIIEWLTLDDTIKVYKEKIKDITEEKKQFETQILDLMNELKQDVIITDKGNLTRNVTEKKGAITPELIKSTLSELLKCSETADVYTCTILDKRVTKENVALKRKDINDKPKIKKEKKDVFGKSKIKSKKETQ
jgi:hypothetical protein